MKLRPTRKRESDKARRERETYEAAIAEQRANARGGVARVPALVDPTPNVPYDERIPLVPLPPAFSLAPPAKLARSSDVETSHQAVPDADRRRSQQAAIMAIHRAHPDGLTDDEVSVLLGDDVWRRCSELRDSGLLTWKLEPVPAVDGALGRSERPVTRAARSGRQARVSIIPSDHRG